jgi:hypothetical protein
MITMGTTGSDVTYTDDQLTQVTELWQRLIDNHVTGTYEVRRGYAPCLERVTAEHLADLIASNGEETEDFYPVEITLASYSDLGGSDLDAANVRTLDGTPGVTVHTGGRHGSGSATVLLGELPTNGDDSDTGTGIEWLSNLIDLADAIAEYGYLSDEDHSAYTDELAEEAWDAWLRSDVVSELESVAIDGFEMTEGVEQEIKTAYYSFEDNDWSADSATSVTNGRHDEALAHAALTVLGWNLPARKGKLAARKERARLAREAFDAVWSAYLAEDAVPALVNDRSGYYRNGVRDILTARGLDATVDNVRAVIRTEAEHAAHKLNG